MHKILGRDGYLMGLPMMAGKVIKQGLVCLRIEFETEWRVQGWGERSEMHATIAILTMYFFFLI